MTSVWVTLAVLVALLAIVFGYVGVRDRNRQSSGDDPAASRAANAAAHRAASGRHGAQGATDIGRRDPGNGAG